MLTEMKNSENVAQNCQTDYAIVEQNPSQAIVKVTLKYEAFSRINYVTMAQTNKGWKITNVSSVFV
jgi:DNA-binding TFAR19-related protein (PDSD5 family)